jgi:Putative transposase
VPAAIAITPCNRRGPGLRRRGCAAGPPMALSLIPRAREAPRRSCGGRAPERAPPAPQQLRGRSQPPGLRTNIHCPVNTKAFAAHLAPLKRTRWFVYAKRPFAGPKAVLAYLSRYTPRVASDLEPPSDRGRCQGGDVQGQGLSNRRTRRLQDDDARRARVHPPVPSLKATTAPIIVDGLVMGPSSETLHKTGTRGPYVGRVSNILWPLVVVPPCEGTS